MYDPFRGYDQWLTTDRSLDYDELPPHPKCSKCGGFLRIKPDRTESKEDTLSCDGTAREVKVFYSDHHLEVNELLGCGGSDHYMQIVSDCGVDTQPHAAHVDVMWAWCELHRTCPRCGHDTIEVDG